MAYGVKTDPIQIQIGSPEANVEPMVVDEEDEFTVDKGMDKKLDSLFLSDETGDDLAWSAKFKDDLPHKISYVRINEFLSEMDE